VLVDLLREKIHDEPFIDLIYKYLKVGYGESASEEIKPMKIGLAQGDLISPVLSNIYMHSFDVWIENVLLPKYSIGKRKKANPEYTKMVREHGRAVDKTIRTTIGKDPNFGRVYYARYVDDFILGINGSKQTCEKIRDEIKKFLAKKLLLTLNVVKSKITHSTKDKALFLGYQICCTPISKMRIGYNAKGLLVRHTTWTILLAPISRVLKRLKEKGFLNSKNMPTRNGRYINIDL
jgi:retron-type reverse transcriptase